MLLEQLRRSWYDSSPAYARVAITTGVVPATPAEQVLIQYDR